MTGSQLNNVLLVMWIVVTSLGLLAAAAILIWAVRSKQFSQQDRARYLALDDGDQRAAEDARRNSPTPPDKNADGSEGHVPA